MGRRCITRSLGALVALLALAPAAASAQSREIAAARAAFESADLDAALERFERGLLDVAATRLDVVDAHRYLAALYQAVGDAQRAAEEAQAALQLEPSAAPPAGASPETAALFDRLRPGAAPARVRVTLPPARPAAQGWLARATVPALSPRLRAHLGVVCTRGGAAPAVSAERDAPAQGAPPLELRVPPAPAVECVATLTAHAGVVLDRAVARAGGGLAAALTPARTPPPAPSRAPLVAGLVIGGVVVAVAAAVVIGVVVVAGAQNAAPFFGQVTIER